jgi:DNA processing protein
MSVPDGERLARAGLSRLFEPGRLDVFRAVTERGAVAVWEAVRDGRPVPGVSDQVLSGARHRLPGYDPARDLEALAKIGARQVCPHDDEWPVAQLTWSELDDAPPLSLHVRGPHRLDEVSARAVAIVGARAATAYGLLVARELAFGVAERGVPVVSGAAYGIDAAAHQGALASDRAPTVAVLACGLDRAYPAGHDSLLRTIGQKGLAVSELPVGSAPTRSRFLVRNRLIAALSRGTVTVEAAVRSGSLATANRAGRLHRKVMAVPGPVLSAASVGSNQLIRAGALCVTSAADVLADAGPMDAAAETVPQGEARVRDDLPATARAVLDAVPLRSSAGISGIARAAGVSPLVVQQVLPPLVLNGLVQQTADGFRLTTLGAGRPLPTPS